MKKRSSLLDFLVRKSPSRLSRHISGLPLDRPVEILWDRIGIPHIFAQNERDLYTAQGFVHAHDRLWQMETLRRISAGTLAQLVGAKAVELDHFCRLAGFRDLQRRALSRTDPSYRPLLEGYVSGINAYLDWIGGDWPLEFRSLKKAPARWSWEDLFAPGTVTAWFLQTNYLEEILALQLRGRVQWQQWRELFGSDPRVHLPEEDFFRRWRTVKIGRFLPAALAFYPHLNVPSGGSNNWVVAKAEGGKPLLANDPHLDSGVPQTWYFCHLSCPTLNVCGSSMPGLPGIVIGRNEKSAWGFTNAMTDCVDLYVFRVEPDHPTRYTVGQKSYEMERLEETIHVAGAPSRQVTIYRTCHGPVITEIQPGIEAVATLKWYGTLAEGEMEENSYNGFEGLMRSNSANQVIEAARQMGSIGQNIVCADTDGHIGWIASGRIPKRRGYTGHLPADGSSGTQRWAGFVPAEENPHSIDPEEGWIVTANHRTVDDSYPHHITYSWCPAYRHDRIVEMLGGLSEYTVGAFQEMQRDVHSRQAEVLLPGVLQRSYTDPLATEAVSLLRGWDFRLTAGSRGGLVFQVFYHAFIEVLTEDLFADALPIYLSVIPLFHSVAETYLDPERETATELLAGRNLDRICEQALVRTMGYLEKALGNNRARWSWGALHRYHYEHPGAAGLLPSWLLNRGPYPAGGSPFTVNMANYNLARSGGPRRQYTVTTVPSLRMVTSLADRDRTFIMGPMGQSGRPGHPHYADMIVPWIHGQGVPLPLSREGAEQIAAHRTQLTGS